MKKSLLLAAIALCAAVGAQAADKGYYAGVSVGAAHSDFKVAPNQTETSEQLTVGYRYNSTFASEVSYAHLGNVQLNSGASADEDMVTVSGVARTKLMDKVDGFAKVGVGYTKLSEGANEHKWVPVVGAGVEYAVTPKVSLRGEVAYVHNFAGTASHQVNSTVGAVYKF